MVGMYINIHALYVKDNNNMETNKKDTFNRFYSPIANNIIYLKEHVHCSFHALPIFHGASISNTECYDIYNHIYGSDLLGAEMSITGTHFDSFHFPEGPILKAETLASELFGSDGTIFVTSGTTCSNQIALLSLLKSRKRTLIDRNCHQSIHFMLDTMRVRTSYVENNVNCTCSDRHYWKLEELLGVILDAQKKNDQYDVIVLNAQSYDGVIYDVPNVISYLLNHGVTTRKFMIDEAWGAANYFHELLAPYRAMNISNILKEYPDLLVVSTQSAHKSLSCLRQASMIHFRGQKSFIGELKCARFKIHTTSPNYPILTSLDLARAQMQTSGVELMKRCFRLAKYFSKKIQTNTNLSNYTINSLRLPKSPFPYVCLDPSKVSINTSKMDISASKIKDMLCSKYGIYVSRVVNDSILLNFHIGITLDKVDLLINALTEIQYEFFSQRTTEQKTASENFIIHYPPGVPLIVPGEEITTLVQKKLQEIKYSGAQIITV